MLVVAVDRRIWVIAVGFLVAFLIAVRYPSWVLYCMAGANIVMCIKMAFMWRNFRHLYVEEDRRRRQERAESKRRKRRKSQGESSSSG